MTVCPNCGVVVTPTSLPGYPLPDRTGERVRMIGSWRGELGTMLSAGEMGTITGARWPKGYAVEFADGFAAIIHPRDMVAADG